MQSPPSATLHPALPTARTVAAQAVSALQIASHELLQHAHAAEERVRVLSLRATHAAARLAERQREVRARRGRLAERRVAARAQWGALEDTEQRLQEARHEAGKGAVACMMATEGLQARQQRELAALSGALAVRISGVSRSDGTTMQVRCSPVTAIAILGAHQRVCTRRYF